MRVKQVAVLKPIDRFLYWIKERHNIYLRRKHKQPKPWTDDEVLQRYFFTNPYRENDKTTVWFKKNIRQPLRKDEDVIFATVCFRWFNKIQTGEILIENHLFSGWDLEVALDVLGDVRDSGRNLFTGAFMINSPPKERKLEAICRRVDQVWQNRDNLVDRIRESNTSLEEAHKALTAYDGLGGFMAYEVVCDLRYTKWLNRAKDKFTWCNPGPGCIRGLKRLWEEPLNTKGNANAPHIPKDWQRRMKLLLKAAHEQLDDMKPTLEMREIEHSLCEFDKYERARLGTGRMKRTYNGYTD